MASSCNGPLSFATLAMAAKDERLHCLPGGWLRVRRHKGAHQGGPDELGLLTIEGRDQRGNRVAIRMVFEPAVRHGPDAIVGVCQ
jgi:hypothetical protein